MITAYNNTGFGQRAKSLTGYAAGIAAGVSYGMNPLFAKPLLAQGVEVSVMLFWRYMLAACFMAILMVAKRENFSLQKGQIPTMILLGVLFCMSSLLLFESYRFIPSGLATTLIYLYPTFTAIILLFCGVAPDLRTWLCIVATLAGVVLLCIPSGEIQLNAVGMLLATGSAICYALYLTIINRSRRISSVSAHSVTFYSLCTGSAIFLAMRILSGEGSIMSGLDSASIWAELTGLAFFPTMVSLLTLAISTRMIGPTTTGVLGVFEPITAILIGTAAFGEPMTATILAGIVICVAAVAVMVSGGKHAG